MTTRASVLTRLTVIVFSLVMGALWLATVPLTSGLVAHIYGLRYMGTLYGFVFLSHQIGSFLGVWLGGSLYDAYGDYTLVWWVGVGVGLVGRCGRVDGVGRRVHQTRVDVAELAQREEVLRVLGVLEDVRGGLVDRQRARSGVPVRHLAGVDLPGLERPAGTRVLRVLLGGLVGVLL